MGKWIEKECRRRKSGDAKLREGGQKEKRGVWEEDERVVKIKQSKRGKKEKWGEVA